MSVRTVSSAIAQWGNNCMRYLQPGKNKTVSLYLILYARTVLTYIYIRVNMYLYTDESVTSVRAQRRAQRRVAGQCQ